MLVQGKLRPRQGYASDRGGGTLANMSAIGLGPCQGLHCGLPASLSPSFPLSSGHEV